MVGVIVHYARDGITYMIGQCGANSLSSTTVIDHVTCKKCIQLIKESEEAE